MAPKPAGEIREQQMGHESNDTEDSKLSHTEIKPVKEQSSFPRFQMEHSTATAPEVSQV